MPSHKIESIQALRFVFCMLIFSFHFRGMMIKTDVFTYGGDAGVSFFFILSGFVLCLGSGKRVEDGSLKLLPFLRSRLQKLYPLHLAAMLIAVSFNVYLGEGFRPGAFVAQLFLVQSWFLSRSILLYGNGVSWFLGPLFLCYALFPWLYRNIVERRPRAGFIAVVAVYLVCYSSVSLISDQVIDACLFSMAQRQGTESEAETVGNERSAPYALRSVVCCRCRSHVFRLSPSSLMVPVLDALLGAVPRHYMLFRIDGWRKGTCWQNLQSAPCAVPRKHKFRDIHAAYNSIDHSSFHIWTCDRL